MKTNDYVDVSFECILTTDSFANNNNMLAVKVNF